MRSLFFGLTAVALAPALSAAAEPLPPLACVNAVFDSMRGVWGVDDASFDPYIQPASAWQILRDSHANVFVLLTNWETNVWRLDENGPSYTHQVDRDAYEDVYAPRQLLSCRPAEAEQPAVLESAINFGAAHEPERLRIEVFGDHFTLQRFNDANALVDDLHMRRYAPAPPPAPPRNR